MRKHRDTVSLHALLRTGLLGPLRLAMLTTVMLSLTATAPNGFLFLGMQASAQADPGDPVGRCCGTSGGH